MTLQTGEETEVSRAHKSRGRSVWLNIHVGEEVGASVATLKVLRDDVVVIGQMSVARVTGPDLTFGKKCFIELAHGRRYGSRRGWRERTEVSLKSGRGRWE